MTYLIRSVWDDSRLTQRWVTDDVGKQHHLGGSNEGELERLPVEVCRHVKDPE